jgi:lipoprotein-releasing system permease protein
MTLIKVLADWFIPEHQATAESVFFNRRKLLKGIGLGTIGATSLLTACSSTEEKQAQVKQELNNAQLQKINNWKKDEIAGFEIRLNKQEDIKSVSESLYKNLPSELNVLTVQEIYPQIFDWLNLQDTNVVVIWGIMILVSILNIITVLLVLILEKTQLIGIIDALGMRKSSIKKVFLVLAGNIGLKGLAIGNLVSLLVIFLQMEFKLIKLDPASYYVDYVPMIFDVKKVVLINCFTFVVCIVSMWLPTQIINRMKTIDAIQFK